jgi:hypothetical protein
MSVLCATYRRGPFLLTWTEILCAILTVISLVLWDVTQHVLLVSYRRFETTYRSHLQGSSVGKNGRSTLRKVPNDRRSHFIDDYTFPATPILFLMENTVVNNTLSGSCLTCIQCAEASYSGSCECVFYHTNKRGPFRSGI